MTRIDIKHTKMLNSWSNSRERIFAFLQANPSFYAFFVNKPSLLVINPIKIKTILKTKISGVFNSVKDAIPHVWWTSFLKHRFFEFHFVIFIAIIFILTKGASGEGQIPLFGSVVGEYIEETSASILTLAKHQESNSVIDINSLVATSASVGRGGEPAAPMPDLATVQENSVIAAMPASEDYILHGGFRRSQVVEYTVQPGDLISFIASDYGVSTNSILWANNISNPDSIKPGQILRIPPISGVVHIVKKGDTIEALARKYGAEADKIIAFNVLPAGGELDIDDEIIIPDGKIPQKAGVPQNSAYTKSASIQAGEKFAYLPDLGDFFMKPANGFNWGIIHGRNGIDVANSCGTPIFAAADGSVSVTDDSGWNGGFGKLIKIVHTNGTETVYAHLMKIEVATGQAVSRGQIIGLMGTTGQSTGCHLHFEVHGARNPLAKY